MKCINPKPSFLKNWNSLNFVLFVLTSCVFGFSFFLLFTYTNWSNIPFEIIQSKTNQKNIYQFEDIYKRLNQMEEVLLKIEERNAKLYQDFLNLNTDIKQNGKGEYFDVDISRSNSNIGGAMNLQSEISKRMVSLSKQLVNQHRSLDEIERSSLKLKFYNSLPIFQPIKLKNKKQISSYYGYRSDPFNGMRSFHNGIDLAVKKGTPIFATANGRVKSIKSQYYGYGKHILIDHGFGIRTLYAHMSEFNVNRGQKVKRGDVIGYVGSTGRSTGPHLHYEIIIKNKKINPLIFLNWIFEKPGI